MELRQSLGATKDDFDGDGDDSFILAVPPSSSDSSSDSCSLSSLLTVSSEGAYELEADEVERDLERRNHSSGIQMRNERMAELPKGLDFVGLSMTSDMDASEDKMLVRIGGVLSQIKGGLLIVL